MKKFYSIALYLLITFISPFMLMPFSTYADDTEVLESEISRTLKSLEKTRSEAWYAGDHTAVEKTTRILCEEIVTSEVPDISLPQVLLSVMRNRQLFPGHVYIMEDFYNPALLKISPIYTLIEFADVITYFYLSISTFYDEWHDALSQDLHDGKISKTESLISKLSQERGMSYSFPTLAEMGMISELLETIFPIISYSDLANDLMVFGSKKYKGWEAHGINSLSSWLDTPGRSLARTELNQRPYIQAQNLSISPILVDEQVIKDFPELKEYIGYWAVPYVLQYWAPDIEPTMFEPAKFFLVKKPIGQFPVIETLEDEILLSRIDGTYKRYLESWQYLGEGLALPQEEKLKQRHLYKESAERGNLYAHLMYAILLSSEPRKERKSLEAQWHYAFAAHQGNAKAQFDLANQIRDVDVLRSIKYFKSAAEQGYRGAELEYQRLSYKTWPYSSKPWEYIEQQARQGNADAQYYYYLMLIGRRSPQADEYLKLAADQGDSRAQYQFARKSLEIGNESQALAYFESSALQGYIDAQYELACMLHFGQGTIGGKVDYPKARDYFEKAALKGHTRAQYSYALMLYRGCGGHKDLSQAREFFKSAANKGHRDAQATYGFMLQQGIGGPQDLTEGLLYVHKAALQGQKNAICYYEKESSKGNFEAMHQYACLLYDGTGVREDKTLALHLLKQAADQGHLDSQYTYALTQVHMQKYDLALQYSKYAAEHGHTKSEYLYGKLLKDKKEEDEALIYLKRAAHKGHIAAQYLYGSILLDKKNESEALHYLKLAADQGHIESQYLYGLTLYQNKVDPRLLQEAFLYLVRAAEQGHLDANYVCGEMCYNGIGVVKNEKGAIPFYEKAAYEWHKKSMEFLKSKSIYFRVKPESTFENPHLLP